MARAACGAGEIRRGIERGEVRRAGRFIISASAHDRNTAPTPPDSTHSATYYDPRTFLARATRKLGWSVKPRSPRCSVTPGGSCFSRCSQRKSPLLSARSMSATMVCGKSGVSTWVVKGGGIGDFGGGWLEHPRRWLGAQWPGLSLGVCGAGGELGHCQRVTLSMLLDGARQPP